jgi:hypothetical protein
VLTLRDGPALLVDVLELAICTAVSSSAGNRRLPCSSSAVCIAAQLQRGAGRQAGGRLQRVAGIKLRHSPWCWQLLTRWPRTQASQAHFSPSMSMMDWLLLLSKVRFGGVG